MLLSLLLAIAEPTETDRLAARAATITIRRDNWGIAHIKGRSDADAVMGMVYAQAEDDYHRVETNYLTALGRLAERDGEAALWSDLRQKLWIDEADLKARFETLDPALRAVSQGWADGLNLYLSTHPGARTITRYEPWMTLAFSEGSIGGDIEYVDLDGLKGLYGAAPATVALADINAEPKGSNGIALAGSRTRSGAPMLLINPHTSFYFRDVVQVTSDEGLNVFGAVTWGQPFVYQGFNDSAGWMHTSSGLDNRDEFAETVATVDGAPAYRRAGQWLPLRQKPVQVRVRRADGTLETRGFTTLHSVHGPLVRRDGDKMIAFSILTDWAGALEQSFLRTKARDLAAFRAVAERKANSSNNTLFADRAGNIAYLHPQFVPVRDPRGDYRYTVDGSDPARDWQGLHPTDSLPNMINPASGYVFNVNDAPWPVAGKGSLKADAYPAYMDQWGWNPRTDHALALLPGARDLTLEGLNALAYDRALPAFDRMLPALLADYDRLGRGDPRRDRLAAAIAMLRGWDRRWSVDSIAQTVAIHWGERFMAESMKGVRATDRGEVAFEQMAKASSDSRLAALEQALARITALYGRWDVPWGAINRLQRNDGAIGQSFDDSKPSLAVGFPSANWGTLASFGTRSGDGVAKRYGVSGNSFVAVVEFLKDGPRARMVTVGGVNGDPASPHFRDQDADYVAGTLHPVAFSEAEVAAATVETYRPGEARAR